MTEIDLSDYFRQIREQAEYSLQKIEDANQSKRNKLRTDVATTEGKESETAGDRMRAETAHHNGSPHWQELRDHWRAHIAKAREDIETKKANLDAAGATHYAEEAESDAQETIAFALDAIEEAEKSVIYAFHARAHANALVAASGT